MSTLDSFRNLKPALSDPARSAFTILPSDTQSLAILPKAILVGSAGQIALRAVDSSVDVTLTVAPGQLLPIRALYVRATGTTAGALVGLA